jgi:hypothetical protein
MENEKRGEAWQQKSEVSEISLKSFHFVHHSWTDSQEALQF